jgi:hypothetical protein
LSCLFRVLSLLARRSLSWACPAADSGPARDVDEERVPDVDEDQAHGIGPSRGEGPSGAIAYEAQLSNRGFDFETSLFGDHAGVVQYIRHGSDGYASAFGNILDARTARPCTIFTKLTKRSPGRRHAGRLYPDDRTPEAVQRSLVDLRHQFLSLGRSVRQSDVETNQRCRSRGKPGKDESAGGQDFCRRRPTGRPRSPISSGAAQSEEQRWWSRSH